MININKIIYKAIAKGYDGEPKDTNLMHIQDWIIKTYKIVPCVNWDTETKTWKAYLYDYDYDSLKWINVISKQNSISMKEATKKLNEYIKTECVVSATIYPNKESKLGYTTDRFNNSEEALYYAIEKAIKKINK